MPRFSCSWVIGGSGLGSLSDSLKREKQDGGESVTLRVRSEMSGMMLLKTCKHSARKRHTGSVDAPIPLHDMIAKGFNIYILHFEIKLRRHAYINYSKTAKHAPMSPESIFCSCRSSTGQ